MAEEAQSPLRHGYRDRRLSSSISDFQVSGVGRVRNSENAAQAPLIEGIQFPEECLCGNLKLFKPSFKRNIGKYTFSNRVIDSWNRLPEDIIACDSLDNFKKKLSRLFLGLT